MLCATHGVGATVSSGGSGRRVDEELHEGLVDVDREWFCKEVSEVVGALAPFDDELALSDAVADPMETHVNGLRTVQLDRAVGDADSTCVVTEDGCGWLGIAEGASDVAQPNTDAGEHVEACVFAFGDRSNNDIEYATVDMDCAVDMRGFTCIAEVSDAACDSA